MRNKPNVQSGLAGTRTEHDLADALAGEALKFAKYTIYADRAGKEGYTGISRLFQQYADEEKAHAALWMGYLGELGTTDENLNNAVCGSNYDHSSFYPTARENAAAEGFDEIADKLRLMAAVGEKQSAALHDARKALEDGSMYCGDASAVWECTNCGCTVSGNTPPDRCPLCGFRSRCFVKTDE